MRTTMQEYVHELRTVAGLLESPDLVRQIDIMAAEAETGKAKLLIIGCSGNGRCSVANRLLGGQNWLPVAPDKPGIPLRITFGESAAFAARSKSGLPLNLASREELHHLYAQPAGMAGGVESVTLRVPGDLLRRCDIVVDSLDAERPVEAWRELVAGSDYVLLVTSGLAALNQRERAFITEAVVPAIGVSRLGVLVNQMDLVSEPEAVLAYVRASFHSLGQPHLLEACAAAVSAKRLHDPEAAALQAVLPNTVLPALDTVLQRGPVGSLPAKVALCIQEIASRARARLSLADVDLERIEGLMKRCIADEALIQKRSERMEAEVSVLINFLIREDFLHHVHEFRLCFAENLEAEVAAEKDLAALRRNLPGYIEAVWREFLLVQQSRSRVEISSRLRDLQALVEEEVRQILGPDSADTARILEAFRPGPDHVRQLIPQAKGDSAAGSIASALKWAGALTVLIYPPAGGLYLVGEAVGRLFRSDIDEANRKALLEKAREALESVERQITAAAIDQFDNVHAELSGMVTQCYADRLEALRMALEEARRQAEHVRANRDQLNAIIQDRCPQLHRQLVELLGV